MEQKELEAKDAPGDQARSLSVAEKEAEGEHRKAGVDAGTDETANEEPQEVLVEGSPREPEVSGRSCEKLKAQVGRNHGHELIVPESDVIEGKAKSYSIRGSSSHDHILEVSEKEFSALAQGETLRKKTLRSAGHRHRILLRCDSAVLPPERVSACEVYVFGKDGHECIIPEAHVRGGEDQTYDVQGVSGHTHTLTVRGADFRELVAGKTIQLKTSMTDHYHKTVIRYVGAPTGP